MSEYDELLDDLDAWGMVQPRAANAIRTLLRERDEARAKEAELRAGWVDAKDQCVRISDRLAAERVRRVRAEKWLNEFAGGSIPSDSGSGAATPDSRERPALIGDQVDADIAHLRSEYLQQRLTDGDCDALAEIATRYEIIAGAYFAAWQREQHALAGGNEQETHNE